MPPYHANINKRLVKSPRLYFYDPGLAGWLLGIEEKRHVATHPLRGALFENLVVTELMKSRYNRVRRGSSSTVATAPKSVPKAISARRFP